VEQASEGVSRRAFVARSVAAGSALGLSGSVGLAAAAVRRAAGAAAPAQLLSAPLDGFRNSLSLSPFTESVLKLTALSDGGYTAKTPSGLQALYWRHGATEVFHRLATLKSAPQGDADYGWGLGIERARFARDHGMPFNPELGLWAMYGDSGSYQQPPDFSDYPTIRLPGPWTSLTLEEMLGPLRQYGELVARQILRTGARVNYWDIGNECDTGIAGVTVMPLFPDNTYVPPNNVDPQIGTMWEGELIAMPESERIAWSQAHLWPYVGRLIAATAEGIRVVDPNAKFSTHIAHDGVRSPNVQLACWQSFKEAGYLPDLLGTSYYPTAGAAVGDAVDMFEWFKQNATALKSKFGREIFIGEYGYPTALMQPPYVFDDQVESYPISVAGQYDFTHDLVRWGIESGCLAGVRPWAPEYCTDSGWAPMSWFAPSGRVATANPALHAIEDALPSIYVLFGPAPRRATHLRVRVRANRGSFTHLTVHLHRDGHTVASVRVAGVGDSWRHAVLTRRRGHFHAGTYTLEVRHRGAPLIERHVTVA
jgi:Glycosyl hydrolase family 53